jgi:hypothetical protein
MTGVAKVAEVEIRVVCAAGSFCPNESGMLNLAKVESWGDFTCGICGKPVHGPECCKSSSGNGLMCSVCDSCRALADPQDTRPPKQKKDRQSQKQKNLPALLLSTAEGKEIFVQMFQIAERTTDGLDSIYSGDRRHFFMNNVDLWFHPDIFLSG